MKVATWAVLALILSISPALRADLESDLAHLQERWAEVNYQLSGKTQITAFEVLMDAAAQVTAQYPDTAPAWIWSGIIKSTYAGARGGVGALKFAKSSRADLERALELEPDALQGAAYTSLGTLFYRVPGWPLGFGDDDKAEALLLKAIAIAPDGLDSNYFYADYLIKQKRYAQARAHLLKAQAAPPRPNRPIADEGRQREITQALLAVAKKLEH